ncbi:oleosin Ara h 15.0101-like [Gossypium arboreum]|uniref:oleosin Ara h 15.0101-like n=1 Tax=Gossypium arboreum TaxID=29729 RepID=UPI0022F159D7|nr:oleosin Ara h 15.0101-like [Gossypium arboreum]
MLLFLSGLTFTGTVFALVMATPLMVLFSPVLVPAGLAILLVTTGFLFSGGCGVAAITALLWIHNYVQGKHNTPPGAADHLEYEGSRSKSVEFTVWQCQELGPNGRISVFVPLQII